jgi:GntR family transcriptional regulator
VKYILGVFVNMKEIGESKLNKNIPVPLYYQLKQILVNEITSNRLAVGDSIPTEAELSSEFNISRPTIRQALSELVSDGYLYRLKGKGTFVSKPKIDERFFQKLGSFNDEMVQKGLKPSTKVLALKVIPGIGRINSIFRIPLDGELIYLYRLRFADDEPIVLLETYLPYKNHAEIIKVDFTSNLLYRVLEEKYGEKIVKASRKIEAVNVNNEDSKILGIKKNDAILLVKTTAFDQNGIPTEYSEARYRGDRNEFSIELIR